MNEQVQEAVYRGLRDSLSAAIDTGSADEVAYVLIDADHAQGAGQITEQQCGDLLADAQAAGYDY